MSQPGYIVCCGKLGDPLVLVKRSTSCWPNIPRGGVLFRGYREATVFEGRKAAVGAASRSKAYHSNRETGVAPRADYEIYRLSR